VELSASTVKPVLLHDAEIVKFLIGLAVKFVLALSLRLIVPLQLIEPSDCIYGFNVL
jgi:hypothetical protein